MRGRTSVLLRAAKLEVALARRPPRKDRRWNQDTLSEADLEALLPLAEKQTIAKAARAAPAWTAEEVALLERLWAKQAGAGA